jgi:hypothetical protein
MKRPTIVAVSGSTRFIETMAVAMWIIEKAGAIALGCHLLPKCYSDREHHLAEYEGVAEAMDQLHLRKIDIADELFVVNENGYIGESTAREIEYATKQSKRVTYLHREGNKAPHIAWWEPRV